VEQGLVYPLLLGAAATAGAPHLFFKFGRVAGAAVLAVTTFKLARLGFVGTPLASISVGLAALFFRFDYAHSSESFLLDVWLVSTVVIKAREFLLKLQFAYTVTVPWNSKELVSSTFHAFFYPFHVVSRDFCFSILSHFWILTFPPFFIQKKTPAASSHAVGQRVFVHRLLRSSVSFSIVLHILAHQFLSSYPLRGSSVFLVSYLRPLRFWETDYFTKHTTIDTTSGKVVIAPNTANNMLASNFNGLFYEEFTNSLKEHLSSDILTGKLGDVHPGDVYVLSDAENRMTSILHIVELGQGYVVFQLRGLEIYGTYCQVRGCFQLVVCIFLGV
jgi:hypothetical protein